MGGVRWFRTVIMLWFLILIWVTTAYGQSTRKPILLDGKNYLYLRVLARPFSSIYADKNVHGNVVEENVPSLQPFFVYTRPTSYDIELEQGWYEVGRDERGNILGWMRAEDVFEWKQTMCLAFTHPNGRHPVLMFSRMEDAKRIATAPSEERIQKAGDYYQAIATKNIPARFPVLSIEPDNMIDITQEFYLLPILDFEIINDMDGREGRLVKLTAVTGKDRHSDTAPGIQDFREPEPVKNVSEVLKNLAVDIVFVTDTTLSMKPTIESTLDIIEKAAVELGRTKAVDAAINFGFWGYRDSEENIPGIEYTTRNFTPYLQSISEFKETLARVTTTEVDSVDYPEDVFSGVKDAIQYTKWTPGAIRLLILTGDAPSHQPGHPWNASNMSAETLRKISDAEKVYIMAVHLKDPKAKKFHDRAETQYRALSLNPGVPGDSLYCPVNSDQPENFRTATAFLTLWVGKVFELALKDSVDPTKVEISQVKLNGVDVTAAEDGPGPAIRAMFKAALVEWIGTQTNAKAPADIVAWAVDKDLIEPAVSSLDVRLLINKRQLDELKTRMDEILLAGRRSQKTSEDFFSTLQAATAIVTRDPDKIRKAETMAQTGLIPEFLEGLPYNSSLMNMTKDDWTAMGGHEQGELLNEIETKIKAYQVIHDSPERWVPLNKGDDPDDYVFPISLDFLP